MSPYFLSITFHDAQKLHYVDSDVEDKEENKENEGNKEEQEKDAVCQRSSAFWMQRDA